MLQIVIESRSIEAARGCVREKIISYCIDYFPSLFATSVALLALPRFKMYRSVNSLNARPELVASLLLTQQLTARCSIVSDKASVYIKNRSCVSSYL